MTRETPQDVLIYFATMDTKIPGQWRLTPYSKDFYKILAQANIVIHESWSIPGFAKRKDTLWVQLWHGTPLKKMLFDSNEGEILAGNPNHKIAKFTDIQKWDIFITDNPNVNRYFETSFQLKEGNLFACGYPRVKFLVDNINNGNLKESLKEKFGVPLNKKTILYLPTWRDYNYSSKNGQADTDYILDIVLLKQLLGDEYFIIDKNHAYLSNKTTLSTEKFKNAETQELLLIADYLLTDYSSVLFDALAIDIPIILYANDFEKYKKSRGVYPEIWNELLDFVCEDIDSVVKMINGYTLTENYDYIKTKYAFCNQTNALTNMIFNYAENGKAVNNTLVLVDEESYNFALARKLEAVFNKYDNITVAVINSRFDFLKETAHFESVLMTSGFVNRVIEVNKENIIGVVNKESFYTVVVSKKNYDFIYKELKDVCKVLYYNEKENRLEGGLESMINKC